MWVMKTLQLPTDSDALLSLIERVRESYQEPPPAPPRRGKRRDFSALSFLLLAAVAVVLRTFRDAELHALLSTDQRLRQALGFGRVPHRTTIGRRLVGLVPETETQIRALGAVIATEVESAPEQSQVGILDGRMYKATGPRWHKADRALGRVPPELRNVDTDAAWSKSGYRGWVQGYRLLLAGLALPHPVPTWATWRSNREGEVTVALAALQEGQLPVSATLLADSSFGGADFTRAYWAAGGWVLTPLQLPRQRRSWKHDLYDLRKQTIELLFQRLLQTSDLKQCVVRGHGRNGAFVLASVWLYQTCFLGDYRAGKPLAQIKEHVDCARWRVPT